MFSHPLINPLTRTWFPRSTMMDEWSDMLSWQEHHAQQQRVAQQSQQLQHTSKSNCNAACGTHCMQQTIQPYRPRSSTTLTDACTSACGGDALFLPTRHSNTITLDWSGTSSSDKQYIITAHLPYGTKPDDVSVSVDELDHLLTIKCQQKFHQEEKDKNGKIISSHSSSSYTQRTIQIPHDVDLRAVSASKNQGEADNPAAGSSLQLLIHMPKLSISQQKPSVKQIHIQ